MIARRVLTRRVAHTAAPAALCAVLVAGCSVGVEKLPLPAPGIGGAGYHLTAVFSNALNLPDRAKVRLGGADVGEVVSMSAEHYTAVVGMRILDSVRLPVGTTAELRSATPLGDIFVALREPEGAAATGAVLHDGDTIPLASTVAATTVEQVLASSSMLVNGGVIRNLTRALNGVGSAVGHQGEGLATMIRESRALVTTMSARAEDIRTVMKQTAALADELNTRRDSIDDLLTSSAPALTVIADNTATIVDLVDRLSSVTRQLQRFPSIAGTDTRSLIHDLNELSRSFNDVAVDPRVTMSNLLRVLPPTLKLFSANATHSDVDLQQIALGHIPDKNHLGDPGFHGPKWADWENLVGSLRFVLTQLGDRVWGPDRDRIWGPRR
ncbi:MlaD family protein [Mycobacterium bourgelatii]|uniref:Putative Mce family protein n=1 Tax=Mycobacterium bourgelatii TaxID=1273442 RepID=A0A7I9YJ39_MYCBU|nr:MlaD family protein [Mycobacterium bourgelatii]MCV6975440.1 MCE family protein [Mycobacterium bourgelatii]GFG88690.1 putative Mce family protein [Mycobacterium bourgelatii]